MWEAVQLQLLELLELVVPALSDLPGDFTRWDQVGLLKKTAEYQDGLLVICEESQNRCLQVTDLAADYSAEFNETSENIER